MIRVACPHCHKKYALDDRFEGKRAKCKACDTVFLVAGEPEFPPLPDLPEDEESFEVARPRPRKARRWLPIAAVCLAIVLVGSAGLFFALRNIEPREQPSHVDAASVTPVTPSPGNTATTVEPVAAKVEPKQRDVPKRKLLTPPEEAIKDVYYRMPRNYSNVRDFYKTKREEIVDLASKGEMKPEVAYAYLVYFIEASAYMGYPEEFKASAEAIEALFDDFDHGWYVPRLSQDFYGMTDKAGLDPEKRLMVIRMGIKALRPRLGIGKTALEVKDNRILYDTLRSFEEYLWEQVQMGRKQ